MMLTLLLMLLLLLLLLLLLFNFFVDNVIDDDHGCSAVVAVDAFNAVVVAVTVLALDITGVISHRLAGRPMAEHCSARDTEHTRSAQRQGQGLVQRTSGPGDNKPQPQDPRRRDDRGDLFLHILRWQ